MLRTAVIAIVCVSLLGCDTPSKTTTTGSASAASASGSASVPPARAFPSWPTTTKAMTPKAAAEHVRPGEQQRVELVTKGAAPHSKLAYAPKAGVTSRLTLVVDLGLEMTLKAKGQSPLLTSPPKLIVTLDTKPVVEASKLAIEVRIVKVDLEIRPDTTPAPQASVKAAADDKPPAKKPSASKSAAKPSGDKAKKPYTPPSPAEELEQLEPIVAMLIGMDSKLWVDGRGLRVAMPVGDGSTPVVVLQVLSSIVEAINELVIPMPRDEIGIGARWRALSRFKRGGVTMIRQTHYELEELTPSTMSIKATFTELSVDVDKQDRALGDQAVLSVIAGAMAGTQQLRRKRAEVMPTSSHSKLLGRVSMNIKPPPSLPAKSVLASLRMQQSFKVAVAVAPAAPDAGTGDGG